MGGNDAPTSREVLKASPETPDNDVTNHDAAPVYANQPAEGTGDRDSDQQCTQVQDLICKFADCFALSMKEVNAIPGAVHKLNILEGTKLQIKVSP